MYISECSSIYIREFKLVSLGSVYMISLLAARCWGIHSYTLMSLLRVVSLWSVGLGSVYICEFRFSINDEFSCCLLLGYTLMSVMIYMYIYIYTYKGVFHYGS